MKEKKTTEKRNLLVTGIVHVTGEPDTGKTTFCLECGAQPEEIWFVDDDVKGRSVVAQLMQDGVQFGKYDDLVALGRGLREIEFHEACLDMISKVKPGEYKVIIWDTWTRFANTTHDYVVANPSKFRMSWSPKGDIRGSQTWKAAREYEASLLHRLSQLAEAVFVVTHLKEHNINGVRTGKRIADASPALERVAVLRLWLRHNHASPVPVSLVLKRLGKKVLTSEGLRTEHVLPHKITPHTSDRSLWDSIRRYMENPVGARALRPDEIPDEYEYSIIEGGLTRDQRRMFELLLQAGVVVPSLETETDDDGIAERVQALRDEGKTIPEIASIVGLSIPEVAKMLK